jgi:uncharacterized membrane protein YbhN (UPF0104 family)
VQSTDAHPSPSPLRRWLVRIIPIVLLIAAGVVLWREFRHTSPTEIAAAMRAWGHRDILAALALTVVSFILMGVVEWLGLRWVGAKIPWGPAMGGSFLANAIAHALGANLLVAGAVRVRMYDRFGVKLRQIAAATIFHGMSFAVGIAALGGLGLLLAPREHLEVTAMAIYSARLLGAALVAFPIGYVILCAVRTKPLEVFGRTFQLPSLTDALGQLIVGVLDNATAAAIIWVLLPDHAVGYPALVGAYAISCVGGLISSVPAGVGVFESLMSALLPGVNGAALAAAFLGYRLAYFILPLLVAVMAMGGDTLLRRTKR